MHAGRCAVDAPETLRRRHTHAAKKWMHRDLDPRSKPGHHALAIQRNNLYLAVGKILWQKAPRRAKTVVGVVNRRLDLLDANLERVTRLSFLDEDRAVQNMPTRPLVRDLFVDVAKTLLDLFGLHAGSFEACGTVCAGPAAPRHRSIPRQRFSA